MVSLQDLEVVRVVPTTKGLYVSARYAACFHEYSFYISTEGRVEGKTSAGEWLELSNDASRCLESKVQCALLEQRDPLERERFYLS